jgi:hypothetical protein
LVLIAFTLPNPIIMLSQLFSSLCTRLGSFNRPLNMTLCVALGAIAAGLSLPGISAAVASDVRQTRTATAETALLQKSTSRTAAALGNPLATNYRVYCGKEGIAPNGVVVDRPLCENASVGGDGDIQYDVPVSKTIAEPRRYDYPLQEPIVLYQYDKAQLYPR